MCRLQAGGPEGDQLPQQSPGGAGPSQQRPVVPQPAATDHMRAGLVPARVFARELVDACVAACCRVTTTEPMTFEEELPDENGVGGKRLGCKTRRDS